MHAVVIAGGALGFDHAAKEKATMRGDHAVFMLRSAHRFHASGVAVAVPIHQRKRRAACRGLLALVIAAVVLTMAAGSASAATAVHVKRAFGPVAFDVPAGALCDFAYHEEDRGTQNLTRFSDGQGNLVRVEDQLDVSILHRNIGTGQTLTEDLHSAAHVDLISGQAQVTGESWHLRTEGGRLVLSGAGLIATDLVTGDILRQTPNAMAGTAATICPALGGSPAT
jgi:hypothetical protein